MIETRTQFLDLGFQGSNALLDVGFRSWRMCDEPTHPVGWESKPAVLELAERVAHSHLCDTVFLGQLACGRKAVPDCLLAVGDLFQQVIKYTPVWLRCWFGAVGHATKVQQLT